MKTNEINSIESSDVLHISKRPPPFGLNDNTFADLLAAGDRISSDGEAIEKLIWRIRAEAYGQFQEATLKYLQDESKVNGSGSVEAVVAAGNRVSELEKLYWSAVALRNRAVHFAAHQLGDTESTVSRWPALKHVFDARKQGE